MLAISEVHFCGVWLYHVSDDWKLQCFILGCYPYDLESHSAINTRKFVKSKLCQLKLQVNDSIYVVSDNKTKMQAPSRLSCQRIGCSVHYINKQLEHAFLKKEIDKSPVLCDVIQNLFSRVKIIVALVRRSHKQSKLSRKVGTYSDTRFNGAFHMMNSVLLVINELSLILDGAHLNEYIMLDKDLLEQICSFLKVFDEVIEQLSDDKKPTTFKVLPLRKRLLNEHKIKSRDHQGLTEVKVFLGEFLTSSPDRSFFLYEGTRVATK